MRLAVLIVLAALGFNQPCRSQDAVIVPPGVTAEITRVNNGCLIAALEMQAALIAQKDLAGITWAKIVRTHGTNVRRGHAFCVYALLNGDVWAYDIINGSTDLGINNHDIDSLVAALKKGLPEMKICGGEFIG
jgi:hypothetical protein